MDGNTVSLIQTQFNNERYNAQVYLALASACENMAYDGLAKFFRTQADGEVEHAQKFAEFLISKRILPEYRMVPEVKVGQDLPAITRQAYDLEVRTTGDLSTLQELCDDPQTSALLQWYLVEQIEEETVTWDLHDLVLRSDETGWLVIDEKYSK